LKRLLLLPLLVLVPFISGAQDRPAPTSLLPDIDPQDIEIRGEFRARFPGLNRQPILGFNPTPRVFRLDPDRMPYIENPDQVVATIQVAGLEAPRGPDMQFIRFPSRGYFHSRFGVGRYISPEADMYAGVPLSENTFFRSSLNYHSTDGHRNRDVQPSSFRFMDASVGIQNRLSRRTKLGFDFDFNNDFNYGISPEGTISPVLAIPGGTARKAYNGFSVGSDFTHYFNAFKKLEADVSYNNYRVNYNFPDVNRITSQEHLLSGSLNYQWPGSSIGSLFAVGLFSDAAVYEPAGGNEYRWHISGLRIRYDRQLSDNLNMSVTGRAYATYDIKDSNRFFLYPDGRLEYSGISNLTLMGRLGGYIVNDGLKDLHETNRFTYDDTGLINRRVVFALGEAKYEFLGSAQVYAGLAYYIHENYRYFLRNPDENASLFSPEFDDDTRKRKLYGGFRYSTRPYGFTFYTEVYVQKTELDDGTDAPFAENFGVTSGITIRPVRNFNVTIWSDFVGDRPYDLDGNELGSYFLPGARIEYRFSDQFGLYLKFNNLLDREYEIWNGYTERQFQVYGGITIKL
jgi:hypothetical protein